MNEKRLPVKTFAVGTRALQSVVFALDGNLGDKVPMEIEFDPPLIVQGQKITVRISTMEYIEKVAAQE